MSIGVPGSIEEGIMSPVVGISGGWEPPDMGDGNHTLGSNTGRLQEQLCALDH